ncbi:MAG: N-acetylmuramoyl-L-alanine amidase [Bryobacteraceae bacterium]
MYGNGTRKTRRLAASLAVAFALALSTAALARQAGAGGSLRVTSVRFWPLGESTRVVIEVSGEFTYRYDRLSNPERIYFDIPGSRPVLSKQRILTIPVGDTLLQQIRVSETQPNVTRVVLDLNIRAEFTAAQLANPPRLVVELKPPARPASQAIMPEASGPAAPQAKPAPAPTQAAAARAASAKPEPPKDGAPASMDASRGAAAAAQERIAVPAKRGRTGSSSLVRALGLKLGKVVIDPGHGGHDTGTISKSGLMEKDLVLDVALRLGPLIEERLNAEVLYTRKDDTFVPLEARTAFANAQKADLFLSIHANSGVTSATGFETYYLNFGASKRDLEVAARENAGSERTIHELESLIEKILKKDKADESREFAAAVQSALFKDMVRVNRQLRNRGVRSAPFLVLIGANMPSILVEIAFLSNPNEERLLKQESYRQRLAESLAKGVSQYASTLSQFQASASGQP